VLVEIEELRRRITQNRPPFTRYEYDATTNEDRGLPKGTWKAVKSPAFEYTPVSVSASVHSAAPTGVKAHMQQQGVSATSASSPRKREKDFGNATSFRLKDEVRHDPPLWSNQGAGTPGNQGGDDTLKFTLQSDRCFIISNFYKLSL